MRTTLTLEPPVEALREGIPPVAAREGERAPFVVVPFTLRLKPGVDPDRIGHCADDLDDAEKLRKSAV